MKYKLIMGIGDWGLGSNNLVNMNNIPDDYGQQNNEEKPGF